MAGEVFPCGNHTLKSQSVNKVSANILFWQNHYLKEFQKYLTC